MIPHVPVRQGQYVSYAVPQTLPPGPPVQHLLVQQAVPVPVIHVAPVQVSPVVVTPTTWVTRPVVALNQTSFASTPLYSGPPSQAPSILQPSHWGWPTGSQDVADKLDEGRSDVHCSASQYGSSTEPPPEGDSSQFMSLLKDLENRMDLMTQMQQARNAIQQQVQKLRLQAFQEKFQESRCDSGLYEDSTTVDAELSLAAQESLPNLWAQIQDQRECINRLTEEVAGHRARLGLLPHEPVPVDSAASAKATEHRQEQAWVPSCLDETQPITRVSLPVDCTEVAPFHRDVIGSNVLLTEAGYTATRAKGCRESVVLGSRPLRLQESGRYFEVIVREVLPGWLGGMAIGVTSTSPETLHKLPDKAWRIPSSVIIGYNGSIFVNGEERPTSWRPERLDTSARVGLLVPATRNGDVLVFVDGQAVLRIDGGLLSLAGPDALGGVPDVLFPVVDIFAATRAITLCRSASVPQAPWEVDEARPQPISPLSRAAQAGLLQG